jgi:hypothetical protein
MSVMGILYGLNRILSAPLPDIDLFLVTDIRSHILSLNRILSLSPVFRACILCLYSVPNTSFTRMVVLSAQFASVPRFALGTLRRLLAPPRQRCGQEISVFADWDKFWEFREFVHDSPYACAGRKRRGIECNELTEVGRLPDRTDSAQQPRPLCAFSMRSKNVLNRRDVGTLYGVPAFHNHDTKNSVRNKSVLLREWYGREDARPPS